MRLSVCLGGHTYSFRDVRDVMGKANEEKSGDQLCGVAAQTPQERVAARIVLSEMTVKEICEHPAVPYEQDEVTRLILDGLNLPIYREYQNMTIGELRERILSAPPEELTRMGRGLSSEVIAAVCKLMSNLDLIYAAARMRVKATCVTTIGEPGTLSARLQPNHPVDDVEGITASVLEGLSFGIGDAVIGLNPVDASTASVQAILTRFDELKRRYEIPTQICVLAHVTTQTGQGSELSSDAHNGWDQLTMESRCYGFARHYAPFLVNTVVGFIGPEYLYDSRQFIRAGLEDHFMGKLHGLPMGCDCCYTNHMRADQNDNENLAVLLASAGCNYFMGVPHADDVMLNYQSTGYHDVAAVRETLGLAPIAPFARWLERWGFWQDGRLGPNAGDASVLL